MTSSDGKYDAGWVRWKTTVSGVLPTVTPDSVWEARKLLMPATVGAALPNALQNEA